MSMTEEILTAERHLANALSEYNRVLEEGRGAQAAGLVAQAYLEDFASGDALRGAWNLWIDTPEYDAFVESL